MSTGNVASAHRGLAFLFLGLGVLQFFLAGLGVFGESIDPHRGAGLLMTLIALILVILAAVGRREAVQGSVILLVLMILQSVLAQVGDEVSVLGALHPVNGLLLLFVAHQVARGLPLPVGGAGRTRSGAAA